LAHQTKNRVQAVFHGTLFGAPPRRKRRTQCSLCGCWISEMKKQSDHQSPRVGILTQLVTSKGARAGEWPNKKPARRGPACAEGTD